MNEVAQLDRIETMLAALLKSGNHLHWIGGFVYGRTSRNDPFVILYPASDRLQEKAVRVYEHHFKQLPPCIPTDHVPADTEDSPNKERAQRQGIYHPCPLFQVVTYDGRETQMGPEKRFGGVVAVSREAMRPPNGQQQTAVEPHVGQQVKVQGEKRAAQGKVVGVDGDVVIVEIGETSYRVSRQRIVEVVA